MGARNHPAATGEAAPGTGKAAVAAEPGVLPGSSGSVEIPGTSIATHFAFWDLIDHAGWHKLPGPSRLSSVGAAAS